jgi:multidrug efflux pump subunit AcrA (membrane-fusion protein)
LQQAQQDPNVLFDLESKFAPTGIYATQQELAQQQALDTQTQLELQQQLAKEETQRDALNMLLGAADLTGQRVDVKQSPVAQIGYTYDIGSGSIFGGGDRAQFYERLSPYGQTTTRGPTPFAPNLKPPVPRKRGGVIDTNKELLRVIGED